MAITIKGYPHDGGQIDHHGLSTDTKPTTGIGIGSTFYCTDTNTKYEWTGSAWVTKVDTVAISGGVGISSMPVTTTFNLASAANTNGQAVKASPGTMFGLIVTNVSASVRYLKLYNKATAPTLASDVPMFTIPIPANSNTFFNVPAVGIKFPAGIALAITGAMADTDTTAIGANEVRVVIPYI